MAGRDDTIDLLAENSQAGQILLRLSARGSSIIAELQRLSDNIPGVFTGADSVEAQKYARLLFDFRFLKNADVYEAQIEASEELSDLDDEFRENHLEILERFFQMFESIFKYLEDLNQYIQDLQQGVFQVQVEDILQNTDGRQLMCEVHYLYGCMLLLLDLRVPGVLRERLIVSYYRYKGSSASRNVDSVIKLCASTGFVAGGQSKRIKNYPDEYFARFSLDAHILDMVIGKLCSDDVFNQGTHYPAPQHRSTSLCSQAAMLYVLLLFRPQILHTETAMMRSIVDKHFPDNWVIAFYMGSTVDLSEAWEPYKAAKAALSNTLDKNNVAQLTEKHARLVPELTKQLRQFLTDGVLTDEFLMDKLSPLLAALRNFNVTLRWLMLHRRMTNTSTSTFKKMSAAIREAISDKRLLLFLMDIAQFEFKIKAIFGQLLETKEQRWDALKQDNVRRMQELSEYFSGEKALTRVKRDENLEQWFADLATRIGKLDMSQSTAARHQIARLVEALTDVEEFHQMETSLQIKQFLAETRTGLQKMTRTANVKRQVLVTMSIVSDFSYAWEAVGAFVGLMHSRITEDPRSVKLLRAVFLKMVSILDLPLVRINQCGSNDVVSVASFYSGELVQFVRTVLQIIPDSVFAILNDIVQLKTTRLKDLPMKIERQHLKDYAQLAERFQLAKSTHRVSVFTEGILAMETTLVGVIQIDPKSLLEDGIRKVLIRQVAQVLHQNLQFRTAKAKPDQYVKEFEAKLQVVSNRLESFRQSFEYIQDYLNIYGLKMWQEEFSRLINYSVEQESNRFLKKKVYDRQSLYQSDKIPIPRFQRVQRGPGQKCVNFIGRLAEELIEQTHLQRTVFSDSRQSWFHDVPAGSRDARGRQGVGIRTFDMLNRGVGVFGLTGLDRLISFMIVSDLQGFVKHFRKSSTPPVKAMLADFSKSVTPLTSVPQGGMRLYSTAVRALSKLWPALENTICNVGQKQLIRRQIANELNFSAKLDSKVLVCALEAADAAVLNDIKLHYAKPDDKPYPDEESPLLPELADYLDTVGIGDPLTKIYLTAEPLESFPLVIFLFVLSVANKLVWNATLGTLVRTNKNDAIDGIPLIVGVSTLLKQFHSTYTQSFVALVGQYVRTIIQQTSGDPSAKNAATLPTETLNVVLFLEEFCRFIHIPRQHIHQFIPPYVFDTARSFASA